MGVAPLSTRVNNAATAGSDTSSNLVARLRWSGMLFGEMDVMIRPTVWDFADGFVDRGPWLQSRPFRVRGMRWFRERG